MADFESNSEYLKSWSSELSARANRVRQLIGGRHWPTEGRHKEVIVREFIQRYISSALVVGGGFIKSSISGECSKEIDILITDPARHPAYFNEGGVQIVPPSSVVACLEIKSSFTQSNLQKAVENIASIKKAMDSIEMNVWRCVFFMYNEKGLDVFSSYIARQIEQLVSEADHDKAYEYLDSMPTCVATLDTYVAFISSDNIDNNVVLNCFDFGDLSCAAALDDLFEHVRAHFGESSVGELSELISALPTNRYIKKLVPICEKL